jgi:hypothetical protein
LSDITADDTSVTKGKGITPKIWNLQKAFEASRPEGVGKTDTAGYLLAPTVTDFDAQVG